MFEISLVVLGFAGKCLRYGKFVDRGQWDKVEVKHIIVHKKLIHINTTLISKFKIKQGNWIWKYIFLHISEDCNVIFITLQFKYQSV